MAPSTTHYALTLLEDHPSRIARATFPPEHLSFQGHFPNNPILPAFVQVQLALDTLSAAGLPHTLVEVTVAKFLRPLPPELPLTITLTPEGAAFDVTLAANDETCSSFRLTVR